MDANRSARASSKPLEAIAKRIVDQPLRSVAFALLAGAWLGYERPRRGIVMGMLRMLVMNELRVFADGLPPELMFRGGSDVSGVMGSRGEPHVVPAIPS